MKKGTLLFLVALIVGLGFLWRAKQRDAARGGPALAEYPLCPGLVAERVSTIRIDHVLRSFQLKLERDAAGRWSMTDPVAYPAQSALVRTLLATLEGARGEPAPEADPGQVGLDPPEVVLECLLLENGATRSVRIELGAVDVDSSLVYARVPGHPNGAAPGGCEIFRTTRALTNTLERNPDDYRERRATPLQAQDVLALRRRGQVYLEEEKRSVDLAFDALLGPDGWKRSAPIVSLDPNAMGLFTRGATELGIERFVDDSPTDLARWGLAEPSLTIELEVLSGNPVVLSFGHQAVAADAPVGEITWYCQRRGYPHVWEVRTRDVELLTRPADLFYDQLVVRMLRSDVARLELEGDGGRRVLAQEKLGWSVWLDGPEAPARNPGSAPVIEEALALLERAQLVEHFPQERFEPCEPPASFRLELKSGASFGGALGRATRDPKSGAQGRQFLRDGDEVVALIGDEILELCRRPLEGFRSRKVHQIQESQVREIVLEARAKTYAFVNSGDNLWSPRGLTVKAPADFLQALDGLLNLAAERWLEAAPADDSDQAPPLLGVRILPLQGNPYSFAFARAADGGMLCRVEGDDQGRKPALARVDGAVVERLLHLFEQ